MSWPLSDPCVFAIAVLWSRSTPGWICITRPSSQDISAIWNSMLAANAATSASVGSCSAQHPGVQAAGRVGIHRGGVGQQVAVVGGPGARLDEDLRGAAGARPGNRRTSRCRSPTRSPARRCRPARSAGRGRRARRAGRWAAPARPGRRQRASRGAAVGRGGVGGGDDLDVEPVQQGARTELGLGHPGGDLVVDGIGRLGARHQVDPEDLDELVLQPVARRGAAVELPVLAERPPDLARVATRPGRRPPAAPPGQRCRCPGRPASGTRSGQERSAAGPGRRTGRRRRRPPASTWPCMQMSGRSFVSP